ncbi:MAG: DUF4115 domain-containing protein [Acetobacteraceae bacterium]|nr:MAG: DUF4115 domain-containing protein [Acetobacteraceae bacterium]
MDPGLRAKAETWVQVRDTRAGSTLMNRVLKPGETYAVPAREGLLLSTGNAGGLDIVVDGQVAPGLGAAQAVRRDVPLEPDRLRAGVPVPAAIPVSTAVSVTTSTPAQPAMPPRAAPQ